MIEKRVDMADPELATYLGERIDEVMHYVTRSLTQELHRDEFTANQYGLLRQLSSGRELHMGQLADSLSVTAPAVTIIVDKLEQEGYVRRIRDSKDRRMVKVVLTRRGAGAITRLRAARQEFLEYLLSKMSRDEKESWRLLYDKITSLLRKRAERTTRG